MRGKFWTKNRVIFSTFLHKKPMQLYTTSLVDARPAFLNVVCEFLIFATRKLISLVVLNPYIVAARQVHFFLS